MANLPILASRYPTPNDSSDMSNISEIEMSNIAAIQALPSKSHVGSVPEEPRILHRPQLRQCQVLILLVVVSCGPCGIKLDSQNFVMDWSLAKLVMAQPTKGN